MGVITLSLLFSSAQVGMRSRNGCLALLVFTGSAQINGIAIATFLAIVPEEAVGTDTFFVYHVVDHGIYPVPTSLLFGLAGSAVAGYYYLTGRALTQAVGYGSQQCFGVIGQSNRI